MLIIGVDYHPSDQYTAFADTETGECGERRLNHSDGAAEKFYRDLQSRAASVRVGMEATGYSRWFERLLTELGIELWIGDAAEIKTSVAFAPHRQMHVPSLPVRITTRCRLSCFASVLPTKHLFGHDRP
jgi:hypothetical protein